MTFLPSFNGKEGRTGKEIQTSRDYLITGVKQLRFTLVYRLYGLTEEEIMMEKKMEEEGR